MDEILTAADIALRTLFGTPTAKRPLPSSSHAAEIALSQADKNKSSALMRVNHVGEICAQALYTSQALMTRNPYLRSQFELAASEEVDHLAWTKLRLDQLGGRTSLLNPIWYAGAFGLGLVAGGLSDRISLGFLVETERQVETHLATHLDKLPADDSISRAIVSQMKEDEAQHASQALAAGALELPTVAKKLMQFAAKVMTTTAHYI